MNFRTWAALESFTSTSPEPSAPRRQPWRVFPGLCFYNTLLCVVSGWYAEHIALSVPGADRGSFPGIPPQCPALVCSDCVTKTKADPFPLGSLRVNSGRKCSTLSLLCVSLIICCTSVLLTPIRKEVQN